MESCWRSEGQAVASCFPRHFDAVERGVIIHHPWPHGPVISPQPRPSWPDKARLFSEGWLREGAELLSRPENCSMPVTLTTQETGLNNNSGTFTQADYATSFARRANAAPSFLIVYRHWLRLHKHMLRFWGGSTMYKEPSYCPLSARLAHQLFSSLH
jgi:hypothetical protein